MFDSLLEKILRVDETDPRYSSMVGDHREETARSVKAFSSGSVSILAKAEEGDYAVLVLDDSQVLYTHKSLPGKPAPSGDWMDWWEEDHEKYFGVTKEEYSKLSREERAELEAKLQVKLWVDKEFWSLFAEFYYPEQYDEWWWDGGGKELSLKGLAKVNDYWKKRLENV